VPYSFVVIELFRFLHLKDGACGHDLSQFFLQFVGITNGRSLLNRLAGVMKFDLMTILLFVLGHFVVVLQLFLQILVGYLQLL
jgi:hypothetical protein